MYADSFGKIATLKCSASDLGYAILPWCVNASVVSISDVKFPIRVLLNMENVYAESMTAVNVLCCLICMVNSL